MLKKENIKREKRTNRVTVMLSDKELNAIDKYCKKYKIASRATFLRKATLHQVMTRFMEDYPSLF